MSSPPFSLPPTLSNQIFEQFDNDEETLLSCSLVSSTWRYASQRVLFRSIVIYCDTRDKLGKFVAFVERSPHIRNFIEALHVLDEGVSYDGVDPITPQIIGSLLTNLPHLRKLVLQGVTLDNSALARMPSLLNRFDIEHLDFRPVVPYEEDIAVLSFLGMFRRIHELRLSAMESDTGFGDDEGQTANIILPSIHNLWIDPQVSLVILDVFLHILMASSRLRDLSQLTWLFFPYDTPSFYAFLQRIAPHLRSLEVKIIDWPDPDAAQWRQHIALLSTYSALRTVHIRHDLAFDPTFEIARNWEDLIYTLNNLPTSVTELTITFSLSLFDASDYRALTRGDQVEREILMLDWRALDQALCRLVPRLRTPVKFNVCSFSEQWSYQPPNKGIDALEWAIQHGLPTLSSVSMIGPIKECKPDHY
ncbi:hypothetical protein K474DRAFT_200452 [Panus rudis PR-1116 ss-1]|nr:hypothetical protein K474DRAFT_200452 [Panus rudis PR-1116 ss-1]